jgi:hypothetical protein
MRSASPSSTIASQSFTPSFPQPMSWIDGSVRFITVAKLRAFFT